MKPKILSVGTMYLDINCYEFPYGNGLIPNKEVVGEKYEVAIGGSALIFARVCASIDLPPIFVGKVGKDHMGKIIRELITEEKIIPAFIESPDVSTYIGMNLIGPDESSIMAVVGNANNYLSFEEIEQKVDEYLDNISYLYLGGCFKLKSLLPSYQKLAEKAKEKGVKIVLDHGRVNNVVSKEAIQIIRDLLPLVDYYLPNKEEFLAVWEASTIEEGLEKVRAVSQAVIGVKDAENGVVGYVGKELIKAPAFPVEVINTVGAGDSFNAGFIKAQDLGLNFLESFRFACATAALKISQPYLPTIEKIQELLNSK